MRVTKRCLLVVLILLLVCFLCGCVPENVQETEVVGIVVDKCHQEAYTTYRASRFFGEYKFVKTTHSEEYMVLAVYEDLYVVIEDKEVYDEYKKGDEINLILRQWEGWTGEPMSDIVYR